MFKVMIVDDEILIISLIEKLIDWEKFDMYIVGTADNGMTALQEVKELEPDIVIVDVRMPGYDGITFMQKVREMNEKVRFIVISGHKRFEYAKSAMQYNVEDYLLKPINKGELEQILKKLKEKLESDKQNKEVLFQLDSQLGVSKGKLRSYFFEQLIGGNSKLASDDYGQINQTYFTSFCAGDFRIIKIKLDAQEDNLDKSFTDTLMGRIEALFSEQLEDSCYEYMSMTVSNSLIVLLNYMPIEEENIFRLVKKNFGVIKGILVKFENLFFTAGIGKKVSGLAAVDETMCCADGCLKSRISLGTGILIDESKVREDPGIINIIFSDIHRQKLMEGFRSFQTDKVKLQVLEAFSRADEYRYSNTLIYDEVMSFLSKCFYEYLHQIDIIKGSYEEMRESLDKSLLWCYTSRQMANALILHMNVYIEEYTQSSHEGESPSVRMAKKYIAQNYQNNISLALVAEIVGLSSVYFSVLFKKEMGVNFVDYLNQYRINIAKKLLKDIHHNVNEVAGLAGFPDARYFSKSFKKTVGVTPTEYRNRNIR